MYCKYTWNGPGKFSFLTTINHNKYKKISSWYHHLIKEMQSFRNIFDYFINRFHQRSTDLNHAPGVGVYSHLCLLGVGLCHERPPDYTPWPLEQNKAHGRIITNNTSDLMPWKHFSRHGTRPRDTRTGNSASGECTLSLASADPSARVRASADPGPWSWGIPRSIYARVRGLVFEFKNARDLNGVKNRHLRLFLDQIGCDRSNDT